MEFIYQSTTYCEFTILGLIDHWESVGNVSAYQIASANNIPMNVFWSFYNDYQAIKRVGK